MYTLFQPVTDEIIRLGLDSALRAIPEWRREKALSYKFDRDRYTCASAYLLLKELLATHYSITEDVEFGYGPDGKPFLKSFPEIHFNMSHCPKAVFCAVGDTPVGVDIEEISPELDMELCRECLNEEEIEHVRTSAEPNVEFTRLWTMKEAYLKLTGWGIIDDMKSVLSTEVLTNVTFESEIDVSGGTVRTLAGTYLSTPQGVAGSTPTTSTIF